MRRWGRRWRPWSRLLGGSRPIRWIYRWRAQRRLSRWLRRGAIVTHGLVGDGESVLEAGVIRCLGGVGGENGRGLNQAVIGGEGTAVGLEGLLETGDGNAGVQLVILGGIALGPDRQRGFDGVVQRAGGLGAIGRVLFKLILLDGEIHGGQGITQGMALWRERPENFL